MVFIVIDNCIKCKYIDCVEVCLVDCFYEGLNFLVIDFDECIDCVLCELECLVEVIFFEDELLVDQVQFVEINVDFVGKWLNIMEKKDLLLDVEEWDGKLDKF